MKNDSLSTPLIAAQATNVNDSTPSRRTFCLCTFFLGLLVGVLTQKNDFNTHFMAFLCRHVTNALWLSCVYAGATTIQLLVFLCLLRVTVVSEDRLFDLDRYFGLGSIVGVSIAWIGVVAGSELPILLVMFVSLGFFQCLMWWFATVYVDEDQKESKKDNSEYKLFIV